MIKKTTTSPPLAEGDLGRGLRGIPPSGGLGARLLSLDLARGFTVLSMPVIHTCMLYSNPQVHQSLLGEVLKFIAEGPGAQLFMLLMGFNLARSKRMTRNHTLQRAFILLVAAYLLNLFKFILPLYLDILPQNLVNEIKQFSTGSTAITLFLIGDILHFAAIAYLTLFLITRTKHYPIIAAVLVVLIVFCSPYVWDKQTGINIIDRFLILLNGHPPQAFFPVFPWLVYPLAGLVIGYLYKHYPSPPFFQRIGITGAALTIIACGFPATLAITPWLGFYRTGPADTIFHLGFVLLWMAMLQWISKKIPANPFFTLLTFCSKNITLIYIIQWILICWCLYFTGYMQLDMKASLVWMAGITITTLLLTHLKTKLLW